MREDKVIKILNDVKYQFQTSIDEVAVDKDCEEAYEDNKSVVESLDIAIKTIENQKSVIEELENIKDEVIRDAYMMYDYNKEKSVITVDELCKIIHRRIYKLKGENK